MQKNGFVKVAVIMVALIFSISLAFSAVAASPAKPAAPEKVVKKKPVEKRIPAALIDINTATKEQLMTLPGIDDTAAQKIIEGRPYIKKTQLKSKKILPDAQYQIIKDKIIAKKPPKTAGKKK